MAEASDGGDITTRFGRKWFNLCLWGATFAASVTAFFVIRIVATTWWSTTLYHEALEAGALLSVRAWLAGGLGAMYPASWADASYPLIITPYPPLFHGAWLAVSKILADNGTYLPGRLVADAALVGCGIVIYRAIRLFGASRLGALPFAIMFLTPLPVAVWAGVARVDVPGIFLTLLGLYLYLRSSQKEGYAFLVSAIPFILAGLTKQNLIAAPAAVVFAELLKGRYRRAGTFAAVTAGSVLTMFVGLNAITHGGFFNATVRSLADEIFWGTGALLAADFLVSGVLITVLFVFAITPAFLKHVDQPAVILYVMTSLTVLALTLGKPGSNVNYYIEPIAALCIAGGVGFVTIRVHRERWSLVAAAALAIATAWSAVRNIPDYTRLFEQKRRYAAAVATPIQLPEELVENGPVLAPPWTYLMMAEPRPVYYLNDDYTFALMAAWDKLFPPERIPDDLRAQRIPVVITTVEVLHEFNYGFVGDWKGGWNFWSSPGFKEALFDSYARVDYPLPFGLMLFVPKSRLSD